MALNIKNHEADRLARELAALTGESISQTVIESLRARLALQRARPAKARLILLREIRERAGGIPRNDRRSDDELLGYDEAGLPS